MPETPTFGRFTELPLDRMNPEQQEAYRFAVETRGPLGGPNKIWVHNPKLAKAAAPFGGHFQQGNYSLTEREREIAVIIINSKWRSAYPTAAHERRGKEVGLPAATVEALISGMPASFTDAREQVVYEIAMTLANSRWVPQGLYDRSAVAVAVELDPVELLQPPIRCRENQRAAGHGDRHRRRGAAWDQFGR